MISQTKEMPHSFEAEQALLGAILVNNAAFHRVSEFLRPEHFADPMHGKLFESVGNVIKRGQQVTGFTLKTYIDSVPGLKDAGGNSYIVRLMSGAQVPVNPESAGREVVDAALRRGIISAAADVMGRAYSPDASETAVDLVESHERRLYDLTVGHTDGGFETFTRSLTGAMQQAEAAHKRQGQLSGVPTGLTALDGLLGGLHRSDLIILAGRPSMGKTALATNIAFSAAKAHRTEEGVDGKPVTVDGARVGFFSLEMSAEQLANRILAEHCGISSSRIRRGELTSKEMDRLIDASAEIGALPLYIDDTAALSITALRTRARRLQRQHGLDLIVVDYLQLIAPDSKRNGFNRVNEVTEITTGLKAMAKELDVPVLALSQLSRAVENRQDKRPQLADLRESGSIEQDADMVLAIQRSSDTDAELLVLKHRAGEVGKIPLKWDGPATRFTDPDDAFSGFNTNGFT